MAGSFYLHNLSFKATVSASATIVSSDNTKATIRVTATGSIPSGYNVTSTGIVAKITINGSSSGHLTVFGNGTRYDGSQGAKSVTYDITVDKGTSAKSISWSVEFRNAVDGGVITSTANNGIKHTESGTVSVPAKPSYTVAYNANGGSGAPGSQTKWYGVTLTLSSTVPTRAGYTFNNWALSKAEADAGTWYYKPGSSCGKNQNLTLYAVWTPVTYTVTFNANGGSGAPGNQTKTHGVNLTLSSTIPTRTNYTFKGWGTSASATTASYQAGSTYSNNASITLYAIWELNYVKPRIANLVVNRCLQDGTANDDGTYMRIRFDWSCDRNISAIIVQWNKTTSEKQSVTFTPSGTSGSVNEIVSGPFDTEKTYNIEIFVHDTVNYSPASTILHGKKFVMDFLSGGNGIAFGKAAERNGWAEFGFHAIFNGSVRGNVLGLGTSDQIQPDADFNAYLTPGVYGVGSHATAGTIANNPAGAKAGRLIVCAGTGGGYGIGDWSYIQQWYIPMTFTAADNAMYVRTITRSPNSAPNYYSWLKFTAVNA